MKPSHSCLLVGFVAALSHALQHRPRSAGAPAVFGLDIQRKSLSVGPAARDQLRKRDIQEKELLKREALTLTLDNEGTLYFANVTLGTPGQQLRLDIDTGSSDIWANSATSNLCQRYRSLCDQSGTYNANSSSTYQFVNSDFYIKYADNSSAQGDYGTDVFTMGTTSLTNVPFGIGYVSSSPQGILGVGYAINEASVATDGRTYQNLPQVMTSARLINSPAYSLWLNDLDANTGSILFGGVDSAKYHGSLETLPIIKEAGAYREFIVALTGLTAAGQTVLNTPTPVLLDSGSSLSYLPTSYYNALNTIFNGQPNDQAGASIVNCNYQNSPNTIDFHFSGLTITVPMSEMILVEGTRRGTPVCILGISDAAGSTAVLGDTFLRSAYVVYDLQNNQISMAQTNFNATASNVVEITASGVPGASPVSSPVTSLSVSTGGAHGPTVTAAGLSAAAPTPRPGALAAAAVAVAGLALAL